MQSWDFKKEEPIDFEDHVVGSDFCDTYESLCVLQSSESRINAEPGIKKEYSEKSQSPDIFKDKTADRCPSEVSVRLVPLEFCDNEDVQKYVHRALSKASANTTHSQILKQPKREIKTESVELEMLTENTIAKSSTDSWYAMPYDFCEVARENKRDKVLRTAAIEVEVNNDSERDMRNKSTDPGSGPQLEDATINKNITKLHPTYKCDICKDIFRIKSSLRKHLQAHDKSNGQPHTQSGKNSNHPFICRTCNKVYTRLSHLYRHQKSHRPREFVKCSECEKTFLHLSSLQRHMLIHVEEKLAQMKQHDKNESAPTTKIYKCDICDVAFYHRYELSRHMATHEKRKEYTCDICERTFILKSYLYTHIVNHVSEKVHYCGSCPRYYKQRSSLRRHIHLSHSGKKRFECTICKKSWKHKVSYQSHVKRAH